MDNRIATGDEKWAFYRNPASGDNVWITPVQTKVQIAKQGRFAQEVMLWLVWWNFEGIIDHFEFVQNGAVNSAALYSEQLDDRVYVAALAAPYPALINRKHALLLQHDNPPAPHNAALSKAMLKELLARN